MEKKTEDAEIGVSTRKANRVRKLKVSVGALDIDVRGKRVRDWKQVELADELTRPTDGVPIVKFLESLNPIELDLERERDTGRDDHL